MNLKKVLRGAGFDMIDSPIRNHKPLQLWLKKPGDPVDLYYENIEHALKSEQKLAIFEDSALSVSYQNSQEYKFNIGITVLEELLTSLGLGNLGLNTGFEGGKNVSISYNSSNTMMVASGELANFLDQADFHHPNRDFMRNANADNILVITGVLVAKDFHATIETKVKIDADLEAKFNKVAEGKVKFSLKGERKLEMISEGNAAFPIAVKANRIHWDKGEFNKMRLVTDNRCFF